MNGLRGVLVGTTLLLLAASAQSKPLTPAAAFREACNLSRYSCAGIRRPMIRYTVYVSRAEAYGVYMGGRTIWLAHGMSDKERYVIMVHEMIHYLQVYVDGKGAPFSGKFQQCVQEQEAFEVSDKVALRLNLIHMARNGNFRDYGCGNA